MSDAPRTPPRSVRDGLAPRTQETPEIETPTRTVEVDGVEWTVSEAGRAMAGTSGTRVGVLLLVFERGDGEGKVDPQESEPLTEAMVVGRSLEELSEEALQVAFQRRRPHKRSPEATPFFADSHRPGGS